MKAKLTLIASALLAAEQHRWCARTESAKRQSATTDRAKREDDRPGSAKRWWAGRGGTNAGAQEQKAPGEKLGQVMKNLGQGMMNLGQSMMMGQSLMGHGMGGMMGHGMCMRVMMVLMDTDGDGTLSLEEFHCPQTSGLSRDQVYGFVFRSRKAGASVPFPSPIHRNIRRFTCAYALSAPKLSETAERQPCDQSRDRSRNARCHCSSPQ